MNNISNNFFELAKEQPDLVDFVAYLNPILHRMSFIAQKLSQFDTQTAGLLHNREIKRQIEGLFTKELPDLVKNYCALELRWRNCETIKTHNGKNYTPKDVLLENLEQICALTNQLFQEFQQSNKKNLLTQNRYLMQKSAGFEAQTHFKNQFDYEEYQEQSQEVSIEPLAALMAQHKIKEKEIIENTPLPANPLPTPTTGQSSSFEIHFAKVVFTVCSILTISCGMQVYDHYTEKAYRARAQQMRAQQEAYQNQILQQAQLYSDRNANFKDSQEIIKYTAEVENKYKARQNIEQQIMTVEKNLLAAHENAIDYGKSMGLFKP